MTGVLSVELLRLVRKIRQDADIARALSAWADEYGASLCPNGRPDTFGEGMRAAKAQVKRLLNHG